VTARPGAGGPVIAERSTPKEKPPVPVLSSSMIDTLLRCRQLYDYKYVQNIEPIIEAPELFIGRILHLGLEAHYRGDNLTKAQAVMCDEWDKQVQLIVDSTTQVWDEDRERWKDILQLCVSMLEHYAHYYGDEKLDVVETEHEFNVPILSPDGDEVARFRGTIDMVTKSNGHYQLWDHKTLSSFNGGWETGNHLSRQFRRYSWAWWQETGNMPSEFIVNGLRKKLPAVPQELKKGGLSKRKDIDTTPEVYRKAIKDNKLDEADYAEILDILDAKGNTFFRRDVVYFNELEIEEAGRELYQIYKLMELSIPPIKAPSPLCTKLRPCPYRSICVEDTPEARMMFKERKI